MGKVQGMSQGRQFGQRRAGVCARFPQVQEQHAETSKEEKACLLPAPAHCWVCPHCPDVSGHSYAALAGSGTALLSASASLSISGRLNGALGARGFLSPSRKPITPSAVIAGLR